MNYANTFIPRLIGRLLQKKVVDVTELKQRIDEDDNMLILDVRSTEDFVGEQGHIARALNIPLEDLPKQLESLAKYYGEKSIMTICRTSKRSANAATLLTQHGFHDVHVVKMGMVDWNHNGYPVEH